MAIREADSLRMELDELRCQLQQLRTERDEALRLCVQYVGERNAARKELNEVLEALEQTKGAIDANDPDLLPSRRG